MESPPPESPFFINNAFNPTWFEAWSQVLTLQECDNRYFKRSGGVISGSATINSDLTVLGNMIGPVNVTGNINITGSYLVNSVPILSQATADARYLQLTGGTLTNDLRVLTNIAIGDALPVTLTRDLTILESSVEPRILMGRAESNNNAFTIAYRHNTDGNVLNRLVIEAFGQSNQISIMANGNVGIGSPTATQRLEVLGNVNISNGSSYMIAGTSIDSRYLRANSDTTATSVVRFYASQAAGASDQTIMRLGHTVSSGDWFFRHHRSSGGAENNCLELLNTNSNLLGFSIGTFNGTSVGDGCMLVMNGIQGDGNFIKASSVNCNGGLHINGGIPQSIGANWSYNPTGSSSAGGGTVSVSLYCYNNIWVRGSMYCTSDRRLKNVYGAIDSNKAMNLLKVTPKWYSWKNDETNTPQLGVIAQELLDHGLHDLVQLFKNEDLDEQKEYNIPKGKQLVVSYDKIPLYLLEIIKNQQTRINKLETLVNQLIDLLPKTKKSKFES